MNELITIKKQLSGVDKSKAAQIEATFAPMVAMLKDFEGQYDEIISLEQTPEKCARAKRLRLGIAKVRIDADKVRKEQKEEYLRAGNAIQGVFNVLKFAVADKEEKLKDVETFYERRLAEKTAKLQAEREVELDKYDMDSTGMDLGTMKEEVWVVVLKNYKDLYEARIEAEKQAEADRLEKIEADKADRIRIEKENAKLKKAKAAQDRKLKAERAARELADAKRDAREKEVQRAEAKAKAEHDKELRKAKEAKDAAEAKAKAECKRADDIKKEAAAAEAKRKAAEVICPECGTHFVPAKK